MKEKFRKLKELLKVVDAHMTHPDGLVYLENLALKVQELEAAMKPKPIEEAPDNGEKILADTYDSGPVVAFWNGSWWESEGGLHAPDEIKSWLPLPSVGGEE